MDDMNPSVPATDMPVADDVATDAVVEEAAPAVGGEVAA